MWGQFVLSGNQQIASWGIVLKQKFVFIVGEFYNVLVCLHNVQNANVGGTLKQGMIDIVRVLLLT